MVIQKRGESLSIADHIPEPVDDAENLAALPSLRQVFGAARPEETRLYALNIHTFDNICAKRNDIAPSGSSFLASKAIPLSALRKADKGMSTTEAVALVVAELDVVEPILSEADPVWAVGYVLGLRARANVALERRDAALRDILAGFRLVELMLQDPSEPNVGIANDILLSSAQSLWEAFSLKALTDSQFREIGDQLARIDFARALVAMMRIEGANMVQWGPSFAQPTDR